MKTAIILAAGVGSRLRPMTDTLPKCCIQVGGTSLIRRLVRQLQECDPDIPIYIVVGYLENLIRNEVSDFGSSVRFITNIDYEKTNNMESCRLALESRRESGASLIINADCIYDNDIILRAFSSEKSVILADAGAYLEENMKLATAGGYVKEISKVIPPRDDVVTSIDLYNFTSVDLDRLLSYMQDFHRAGDLNLWTEVAIDLLVKQSQVEFIDVSGLPWLEIDNYDDLDSARRLFPE